MASPVLLSVLAHGAVGAADEILAIALPLLFVIGMALAWWYTRRQSPELEDGEEKRP